MYNLRKYYTFFVLSETAFTQYKDGRYNSLDMGYITMAVLRFFIEENNFNERDITYPQCEAFIKELLIRDFDIEIEDEDMADLILYIFDKIRNDGKAFEFTFYDPVLFNKNSTIKVYFDPVTGGLLKVDREESK